MVDEGWYRLTAALDFGVFNGPKKLKLQTAYSGISTLITR